MGISTKTWSCLPACAVCNGQAYSICYSSDLHSTTLKIGIWSLLQKHFEECRYHFILDKSLFKEIGAFAGWYLFGTSAYIFNTQGVNLIINIFFGVVLNAARGVATQVDSAVRMFVSNFTTALNPQIIKTYAEGNATESFKLVFKGAKFSFFLMLFF